MIADSDTGVKGPVATPIRRRPRLTRFSGAHWLMVIAGVLAFLTNLVVLRGYDQTQTVAAAAIALQPGTRVEAGQLRAVPLDADAEVLTSLVMWENVGSLVGQVATRSIAAGQLVGIADFRPPAAIGDLRAMSLPVKPEHAVGGKLAPGDRVDVIRVVDGSARFVVAGAEVLSVASSERGALTALSDFYVVLAVDAETALVLAEAIDSGTIEVVRSTGAASPPPVDGGDRP